MHDRQAPHRSLKLWQKPIAGMAGRINTGSLTLRFPHGRSARVCGSRQGPEAEISLKNPRPLFRLLSEGDLGFARSYIDGDWDTPDLGAVIDLAIANEEELSRTLSSSYLFTRVSRLRHRLRANTKTGSKRNIAFHYDLGNAFYKLWLDETMTYSSALYEGRERSLPEAQTAKYDRILACLQAGPGGG